MNFLSSFVSNVLSYGEAVVAAGYGLATGNEWKPNTNTSSTTTETPKEAEQAAEQVAQALSDAIEEATASPEGKPLVEEGAQQQADGDDSDAVEVSVSQSDSPEGKPLAKGSGTEQPSGGDADGNVSGATTKTNEEKGQRCASAPVLAKLADAVKAKLTEMKERGFAGNVEDLKAWAQGIVDTLKELGFKGVCEKVWMRVSEALKTFWAWVQDVFAKAKETVVSWYQDVCNAFREGFGNGVKTASAPQVA